MVKAQRKDNLWAEINIGEEVKEGKSRPWWKRMKREAPPGPKLIGWERNRRGRRVKEQGRE